MRIEIKRRDQMLSGAFACLLLAVAAPGASASVASLAGNTVTLTAGPGEVNEVDVNMDERIEDVAGITPGAGCTALSPTEVECGVDWDTFVLSLGDGDDRYESSHLTLDRVTIDAGPGNDRLEGIDANSVATVDAGPGDDLVEGGNGDDRIVGGPGDDTLEGDRGNDTIDGGPGRDTLLGDSSSDTLAQGNDTILARDGEQDVVSCQFGSDRVTADAADVVEALSCESVDQPAAAVGTPPASAPASRSARRRAMARCRAKAGRSKPAQRRKARCLRQARRMAG